MSQTTDLVKQYNRAWTQQDERAFSSIFHDRFSFSGPIVQLEGREAMIDCIRRLPFSSNAENVQIVAEGSHAVQTYDWVVSGSYQARIPTCEVFEIKDGKITRCRRYYDTARLPKQAVEQLQQLTRKPRAA